MQSCCFGWGKGGWRWARTSIAVCQLVWALGFPARWNWASSRSVSSCCFGASITVHPLPPLLCSKLRTRTGMSLERTTRTTPVNNGRQRSPEFSAPETHSTEEHKQLKKKGSWHISLDVFNTPNTKKQNPLRRMGTEPSSIHKVRTEPLYP